MKNRWSWYLLLALVLGSFPAFAGWGSSDTLSSTCQNHRLSRACMVGLIVARCGSYTGKFGRMRRCTQLAVKASEYFDFQKSSAENEDEWVAYRTELVSLMRQPRIHVYLESVRDKLAEGYQFRAKFNLWNHSVAYFNGNTSSALQALAVLFQDTLDQAMTTWLDEHPEVGVTKDAIDLLEETAGYLSPELIYEEGALAWLDLYPVLSGSAQSVFNPLQYHFYPIAYLAKKLSRITPYFDMAFFIPFMINMSYEFRDMGGAGWPLRDPETIAASEDLTDSFMGYRAALWGAGYAGIPFGFQTFSSALRRDTRWFIESLYFRYTRYNQR